MSTKGWAAVAAAALALLVCLPVVVVLAAFSGAGPSASAAGLSSLGGSTALEFAEAFADDIGADNGPAVAFVVAWEASEGSSASHNNPLDSTLAEPGSVGLPGNPDGVQMYPSLSVGLAADVATITGGTAYSGVIAALDAGDVDAAGAALQVSPWCTTPDGGQCPGYGASIVSLAVEYSADAASWQSASSVLVGTTALVGGPGAGGAALPAASGDLAPLWAFLTAQLGKPYQWGGAGPDSWDCSGLVMVAYAQVGIPLEHNAAAQWAETDAAQVPGTGTAGLEPGDLLFWATDPSDPSTIEHVAIYVGDGEVVDAPHTGTVVQVQAWWPSGYFGATRPLALVGQPASTV